VQEHLLVGGENSLGHKKTYFVIPAAELRSAGTAQVVVVVLNT